MKMCHVHKQTFLSIALHLGLGTLILSCMFGCTTQHTLDTATTGLRGVGILNQYNLTRTHSWRLSPQSKIFVEIPRLSQSITEVCPNLSNDLEQAIKEAAAERFWKVEFETGSQTLIDSEPLINVPLWADFVLQPLIRTYEDRGSESKARQNRPRGYEILHAREVKPKASHDHFELTIRIIEPKQKKLLDTVILSVKSAGKLLNNTSPSSMFVEALNEAFTQL